MTKGMMAQEIRAFLLENIPDNPKSVAKLAEAKFNLTRQAINKHLRELVQEGLVTATGAPSARDYRLKSVLETAFFPLKAGLEEHIVWRDFVVPRLKDVSKNVFNICQYGFTEMFNNAIDHSEGAMISVEMVNTPVYIELFIGDDGIGIFNKIKQRFDLASERDAVLELSKGKLTTDPRRHSGEGIFFSSRAFDRFSILSGHLYFDHSTESNDWLLESTERKTGTGVLMRIAKNSQRTLKEIFDQHSFGEGFDITHIPVKLAQFESGYLVSRSQAKRLIARFEKFKRVLLNFEGIDEIGQAFADEVFRVFQLEHPEVELVPVKANSQVKQMIARAKIAAAEQT